MRTIGKYTRVLRASQEEYADGIVKKYDAAAPHPASERRTPAATRSERPEHMGSPGERAHDCRTYVGALMYVVRGTRPDATYAVNRLARNVTCWTKADDAALCHLVGYLKESASFGLEMHVDVRDRKAGLWLELWTDADHAGDADLRSTGA